MFSLVEYLVDINSDDGSESIWVNHTTDRWAVVKTELDLGPDWACLGSLSECSGLDVESARELVEDARALPL